MPLSSFTAFAGDIAEGSEATPGLWNERFSVISQNLDQLNADASDLSVSKNTQISEVSTRLSEVSTRLSEVSTRGSEHSSRLVGYNAGSISTTLLSTESAGFSGLTLANPLASIYGGLGYGSSDTGDIPYSSNTTLISRLAIGASNSVLASTGAIPAWVANVSLTSAAIGDGTALGPSLRFTSEASTGVFRIGSSRLGISIGGTQRAEFNSGKLLVGTSVITAVSDGDIVTSNTRGLRGVNSADNNTFNLISCDSSNFVQVGTENQTKIPVLSAASMDGAAANRAGIIQIDSTNNRLVIYTVAGRYYITPDATF